MSKTIEDCWNFINSSAIITNDLHLAIADDYDEYMKIMSLKHIEYSGHDVHAVRWLGNQLAIIQSTRNFTNIKPANAPQSGSGLGIGSISYE